MSHGLRKRARRISGSPAEVERLLLPADYTDGDSDSTESLSRDAIVLPWWLRLADNTPERLRTFMNYHDDHGRTALARVPATATWGNGQQDAYLCADNRPILLWVVGVLQALSFVAADNDTDTGCDMFIRLLRDVDREALAMINSKSTPTPRNPNVIFHGTHTTSGPHSLKVFSDVYDATTLYRENTAMKRIPASDLMIGDVVLAEASIVRQQISQTRGGAPWGTWKVHFHVQRVSKLVSRVRVKEELISNNFPVSM